MQGRKQAILSFTLLLQLLVSAQANQFTTEMCAAISSNNSCACHRDPYDFHLIECPAIGLEMHPSYTVRLLFGAVNLECLERDINVYDYLPQLHAGAAKRVLIQGCNKLAHDASADVLNAWHITHTQELRYSLVDFRGTLQRQQFVGLPHLLILGLEACSIVLLPLGLFNPLTQLTHLYLRNNRLEHLSVQTFEPLKSLIMLDLYRNRLKVLPQGLFRQQQQSLQWLSVGENLIVHIDSATFDGLSELTSLTLYANRLTQLPADTFASLRKLKHLSLDENNLTALPTGLLANNKYLETFSFELTNGFVLSTVPPGFLANLPELQQVTLSCGLDKIPPSTFYNSSAIQHISLALNNLTYLSETLVSHQSRLTSLDLTANQLLQLPRRLLTRNQLKTLRLAFNNLTSHFITGLFPRAAIFFREQDGERFTLVPQGEIDLRNNDFTTMSHRHLDFLSRHFSNVLLTNNSITTLTLENMDFLRNLSDHQVLSVELNHNPLHCDCRLLQFVHFVRGDIPQAYKNKVHFKTDKLRCAAPAQLSGRLVHELLPHELLCAFPDQCPERCECWQRSADRTLIVNCSNAQMEQVPLLPTLPTLTTLELDSIELHMESNNITCLPDNSQPGYVAVTKIYAAHNAIRTLEAGNLPPALTHLDLRYNRLQRLAASTLGALEGGRALQSLRLSHNAWLCDCDARELLDFAKSQLQRIHDLNAWLCVGSGEARSASVHRKFIDNSALDFCPPGRALAIAAGVLGAVCLLVATLAALYFKYEQELKVWLYTHRLCLCCVNEEELDQNRIYDAFVSYSHKDMRFLSEHLVPQLEHGPIRFRLCVDERDWLAGELIPECIVRSVEASCRVIIVLSRNFIESVWARMEFRSAHTAALNERRARVIVIIYGDIGDIEALDEELKVYLRINIYLKWGEPWFWEKLRYAMPHMPCATSAPNRDAINLTAMSSC